MAKQTPEIEALRQRATTRTAQEEAEGVTDLTRIRTNLRALEAAGGRLTEEDRRKISHVAGEALRETLDRLGPQDARATGATPNRTRRTTDIRLPAETTKKR